MHRSGLCAAIALFSAGNAFALSVRLGTGGTYVVPQGAGQLELPVEIIDEGSEPNLQAVTMKFIADDTGLSIVGVVGGTHNGGTGTRYNDPEWDANTNSLALSPNAFAGPMPANTARGYYGSHYHGEPDSNSRMGYLVISYSSLQSAVHLAPTMVNGVDYALGDVPGTGIGITITPFLTTPRNVTQWRSVRTHGTCGELSILLDAEATGATSIKPTVETRGYNANNTGVLKVQVDFDGPVTLANAADITVTYTSTIQGASPSVGSPVTVTPTSISMADADTLSLVFASGLLPNLGCVNIAIGAGTFVETITGDTDCNIQSLAGDVTSNGTVTTSDMLAVKMQLGMGQPACSFDPKYDINLNGTITLSDLLATKVHVINPTKTAACP